MSRLRDAITGLFTKAPSAVTYRDGMGLAKLERALVRRRKTFTTTSRKRELTQFELGQRFELEAVLGLIDALQQGKSV